ncbi:transposase [Pseudomonas zeae]|uniref:transposase n=1 Tax=Pseudomonas zeae TaxID=2745510 RepID=UPI00387DCD88
MACSNNTVLDGAARTFGLVKFSVGMIADKLKKLNRRPLWMSQAHYEKAPERLTVRELKAGGKTLVTTLHCPKQTPKTALKSLYKGRWHIELDLRNLKATLGLGKLSCKTPGMAVKELWVYLLAHNLIRILVASIGLLAVYLPRELSFKHSLRLLLALRYYGSYEGENGYCKVCWCWLLRGASRIGLVVSSREPP